MINKEIIIIIIIIIIRDAQRLQLHSPSSLLIDSSADTDSQILGQVIVF